MIRNALFTTAILLFAGLAARADVSGTANAAVLPPDQVVEETAKGMFETINTRRAELEKNPQELYKVVGDNLLPHFDFGRASQLVLGQYWRTATPDQRKAFQDAFYKYLVHGYADALLKGNYSERNIQVEPWHPGSDPSKAYVKTKVLRENAPPVEVDYSLLNEQDGWKAFDVVIEGISYVLNYRNQFGPEIQQQGLDELIKRLNVDADKGAIAQPDKQ